MFADEVAARYDDWYQIPIGAFADQVETALIFSLFKLRPGDLVLDAGCGTGHFSLKLAHKGAQVVGVDVAPAMLARAREKAAGENQELIFCQMDICQLDYPSYYFDGVVSVAAFEFVRDRERAFAELMRVLKPGGKLLIATINRDSVWGDYYIQLANNSDSVFRHAHFMTWRELLDLDRERLLDWGECLFIKPKALLEKINMAAEERNRVPGQGGFIAAIWEKEQ
jgi:ubiquinone/menaquinone biosynthesis C-methylase UbiE